MTASDTDIGGPRRHFAYAMVLRSAKQDDLDTMLYLLQRSFTPGDRNYDAQFWYAAYLYMKDNQETREQSRRIFRALRNAPVLSGARSSVRCKFVNPQRAPALFTGTVVHIEVSYGFIMRDGAEDRVLIREEHQEKASGLLSTRVYACVSRSGSRSWDRWR